MRRFKNILALYDDILACIDPTPDATGFNALNHSIMRLATSLSKDEFADLHIVHAWEVEGKDRDTVSSEVREYAKQNVLDRHERMHKDRVEGLLANYGLGNIEHHVHLPRAAPQQKVA